MEEPVQGGGVPVRRLLKLPGFHGEREALGDRGFETERVWGVERGLDALVEAILVGRVVGGLADGDG